MLFVTEVLTAPVATFVNLTSALGITAPVASVTTPETGTEIGLSLGHGGSDAGNIGDKAQQTYRQKSSMQ